MTTAPTDAPPQGFWKIAEAYPDQLALVDPDERLVSAGELLASCNQLVGGLRGHGARSRVTRSRCCCRTASRCSSCTSRSARRASTSSRSTGTSSVPRSRTSCQDCEAKVFVAHARFAEHASRGRGRDRLPRRGPLRGRRRHPRLPRLRGAEGGPVARDARRPHHRHRHELHVGNDRSSEGRAPEPAGHRAGGRWPRLRRDAHHVRARSRSTTTCTSSARRCTTPRCSCSRDRRSTAATPSW